MGSALAKRLVSVGYNVFAWNRTKSKAKRLEEFGVKVSETLGELVKNVEIVHIFVSDDEAVKAVFFSKNTILDNVHENTRLVINHSTVTPQVNVELYKSLKKRDVDFLEAPYMGSWPEAEKGESHIFIGGDENVFERYKDHLSKLGSVLYYVGKVGTASAMKLATNLMLFNIALSLSESIKLVEQYGIKPDTLLNYFRMTWLKNVANRYGKRILDVKYPTRFRLALAAKDLTYAVKAAIDKGKVLPLTIASMLTYKSASQHGLGDKDYTKIYWWI